MGYGIWDIYFSGSLRDTQLEKVSKVTFPSKFAIHFGYTFTIIKKITISAYGYICIYTYICIYIWACLAVLLNPICKDQISRQPRLFISKLCCFCHFCITAIRTYVNQTAVGLVTHHYHNNITIVPP